MSYIPVMRFGHRVQGTIQGFDDKGRGIFDQFAIPFSTTGDEVVATFTTRDRKQKICKIESVEKPGADRVATVCPHAGVCGGCLWQHIRYEKQLELKRDMVNQALAQAGHEERVAEVMACQTAELPPFHFRNRMDYAVGWNGEIGLKEFGAWNRYLDLKTCLLLEPGVERILVQVREWMHASDLQPWDAKFYTGDVRYVVVREGKNTEQCLIVIVVKDQTRVTEAMRDDLRERLSPFATSLLLGEQNLTTDLSFAQTFITLKGEAYLEEVANGLRYRIHPNSFFQTNTRMAEELQKCVLDFSNTHVVLDLYCGLGFFGIYLAKNLPAARVHGFELDEHAIELAKFNAAQNGVAERCEFFAGKAEDLAWKNIPADTVILDPPRSGLHPKVLKTVLEMKPSNIIYVSCNYHRLVEELKLLKTAYTVEGIKAFDLFPHTPHVEVVVKLVGKSE